MRFGSFSRVALVLVASIVVPSTIAACGKSAVPEVPEAPLPEARTVDASIPEPPDASAPEVDARASDAQAIDADATKDAAPDAADASVDAAQPPSFVGPLRDEADAVARAARAADVALDKAYAAFVKRQKIAPSHSGSWAANGHRDVKGSLATGYVVTFDAHPPAGFEYVAVVQVGPRGDLQVKRAEASFSPD